MFSKILLIVNSDFFGRVIKYRLEKSLGIHVLWYKTYSKFLNGIHDFSKINIAIVDNKLPDCKEGEALDFCHEKGIPSILLTNEITHDIQERIWNFKVIDYILSSTNYSVDSIVDITKRYVNNPNIGILIVDGSKQSRLHLKEILSIHRYTIYEATNGDEALNILGNNYEKIQMVITDYLLENQNGIELTENIRKSYPFDRLAIIGISEMGNHTLKVQFIKSGANDFLTKPFISELLYCRITQSLKVIEYFKQIKDLAIIDQLTGLKNRHYLKESGAYFFENAKRHNLSLVVAMLDIDDFKNVNDNYGHAAGDKVLQQVSSDLNSFVRKSDVVIRFGGEEFLVIGNNLSLDRAEDYFNRIREHISKQRINIGSKKISITVSIGVCTDKLSSLEEIIIYADKMLYKAKSLGKNMVCM